MSVHILQLLCPQRHCLIGLAYDTQSMSVGDAKAALGRYARDLSQDSCGLCGSAKLVVEDGPTLFQSVEEAQPALEELQAANLLYRLMHDSAMRSAVERVRMEQAQ